MKCDFCKDGDCCGQIEQLSEALESRFRTISALEQKLLTAEAMVKELEFQLEASREISASLTERAEQNTQVMRKLADAVIMARATLKVVEVLGRKELKQILGRDMESYRLTQNRLEEAYSLADPIGAKLESYHGCFTGDCLHDKQEECNAEITRARDEMSRQVVAKAKPVGCWRDGCDIPGNYAVHLTTAEGSKLVGLFCKAHVIIERSIQVCAKPECDREFLCSNHEHEAESQDQSEDPIK